MLDWLRRKPKRPTYYAEVLSFSHADVARATRWWADVFGCKRTALPEWDDSLPSDVAMQFAGAEEPTILLSSRRESEQAGLERSNERQLVWTSDLDAAREDLRSRGASPGAIQEGRVPSFEIRDPEGNKVEVCED